MSDCDFGDSYSDFDDFGGGSISNRFLQNSDDGQYYGRSGGFIMIVLMLILLSMPGKLKFSIF